MKSGHPRKAPKVSAPSKKNPNYMKEYDSGLRRKSPQQPMKKKHLS